MLKKIRAKILLMPKKLRLTIFMVVVALNGFFIVGSISVWLQKVIYSGNAAPSQGYWINQLLLIIIGMPLMLFLIKLLHLNEKK